MADAKISQLPVATTPLDGTELVAVVQSSTTKQATVNNILTAGLPVSASTLAASGNVTLGDASTDTVQVNGYMGVGGAGSAGNGVYVVSTVLTTSTQTGVWSSPIGTSSAISSVNSFIAQPQTAAVIFTSDSVYGFRALNAIKGAGSTITHQYGFHISDQTQGTNNYGITSLVSSGSNKWNIYASGTAANYFAGNVGIGTSSPAAKLTVVDTTANAATSLVRFNGQNNYNFDIQSVTNGVGTVGNRYNFVIGSSGGEFSFSNSGGERLRIDSSGNVGIGTSSPYVPLTVSGTGGLVWGGFAANSTGVVSIGTRGTTTSSLFVNTASINSNYSSGLGVDGAFSSVTSQVNIKALGVKDTGYRSNLVFYTTASSTEIEAFRLTNTEAVFNDPGNDYDFRVESDTNTHALFVQGSDGNVGIGTNTPTQARFVVSNSTASLDTAFINASINGIGRGLVISANTRTVSDESIASFESISRLNGTTLATTVAGNVGVGGKVNPASGAATLCIFNGTAPTGSVADGIILYAEDVTSSSELKVRDEAGNVTTLSPHNFSLIPEGPSEDMAWAYYSEKGGKRINVDMLKLARMVEKLTGEKLVYEN